MFETSGDGAEYFSVSDDGNISISKALDFEKSREHNFRVKAKNSAGFGEESTVLIRLKNIPDILPILKSTAISFEENITDNRVIGQIEVLEVGDSLIYAYRLIGEESDKFKVNNEGKISIKAGEIFDYESKVNYYFNIFASNEAGDSASVSVSIHIIDIPDVKPILLNTVLSVEENSLENTLVGKVQIYSIGDSAIIDYHLRGEQNNYFTIDENASVRVSSLEGLDYETKEKYLLAVTARNNAGESIPVELMINIINILDDEPIIEDTVLRMEENTTIGTSIGHIEINTTGTSALRTITLTGTGAKKFSVLSDGSVILEEMIDYELDAKIYHLQAIASNTKAQSEAVSVEISILNSPEHPPVLKVFTRSIEENATIGTIIGKIEEDVGGDSPIHSYTLDDNSTFSIDNNGTVLLSGKIDYEVQTSYELNVTASNEAGVSEPKRVNINIIDRGTSPILESTTLVVEEDRSLGTVIGNITILNDGDSPILEMQLSGEGAEEFEIDVSGKVSLLGSYDAEYTRTYNLWVEAENKFAISTKVELTVIIKAISSSAYAGSDMTVLEYQTFMLRANIDDIDMNAVESYQWSSEDTDKIICTESNENCSVEGLDLGDYEATFSILYKNGNIVNEKIKIKVIPDLSNNILGVLKEGLENLSGMKLSKDGTKMFVVGDFEDNVIFKIVDVSDSNAMHIIEGSEYSDASIQGDKISFSINESEDKVALAGL